MKTAKEMYDFCTKNGLGKGTSKTWDLKHFTVIANNLSPDEKVLLVFIGLHNYISLSKHDSNFAYAITNKRIVMAQKKVIGEVLQTVTLQNINDITYKKGMAIGVITFDTYREVFNVGLDKYSADKINALVHDLIIRLKSTPSSLTNTNGNNNQNYSQLEELKKLADKGVITQREFELKKRQILGL